MTPPFQFRRQISDGFRDALQRLVESDQGQWWRDVLVHPELVLAVRNDSLNVYHRGGSIFRVAFHDGSVVAETHVKYLVRKAQAYATLATDNRFVFDAPAVWHAYEGRVTLDEMIAAASPFAGLEKAGLHSLIAGNTRVIDVEVAFRSAPNSEDFSSATESQNDDLRMLGAIDVERAPAANNQDRLDAVTLEDRGGDLWVVFHEAKHFTNNELRASQQKTPNVVKQIDRYRTTLQHYAPDIAASYLKVCRALIELDAMRVRAHQYLEATSAPSVSLDPLVQRVFGGEPLRVDPEPRLIVFGFDKDQRDGRLKRDVDRLKELGLTVYAVGIAKAGTAAFVRKSEG